MATKISFADLTHTGQLVAANTFPLGISYVASYAGKILGDQVELEVFKYPEDFSRYLETNTPQIACFSNFSWNLNLGNEFARRIKEVSPDTVTVFGGPNFPSAKNEQKEFLSRHPAIDCYLEFEGELAFVELFNHLKTIGFDWSKFKSARTVVPNIRYLLEDEIVVGDLAPKISDLSILPSPYMSGVFDKFFDDVLIPMIQTTRGCPYTCAFCWEGGDYFQKTLRFHRDRIAEELKYAAERVGQVPDLLITDANFGMFKDDLVTAREIASIKSQHKYSWPKSVLAATAKNNKERTIELVEILGDTMPPTAAVQSTDDQVLEHIRRKNVSQDALIQLAKAAARQGGQTEAELILCLEGDNKRAHFKTVCDMLDADMTFIRMYQFMMLPGTQSSSRVTREKYEMESRYRVLPRCIGTYTFRGESFPVAEIEEIIIANNTMPYEDYQACRDFHLTVEIFNNDSIFLELIEFLRRHDIKRSDLILMVHQRVTEGEGIVHQLYDDFRAEEKRNLWNHLGDAEAFVVQPGVIDHYIDGEYGTNELYKYRALAVFNHIEELHEIAFSVARALLERQNLSDKDVDQYLSELYEFSMMRKRDPLVSDQEEQREFHFDFTKLMDSKFDIDPFDVKRPDGIEIEVYHSDEQRELINGYLKQYGSTLIGLGRLLIRANMNRLYRSARSIGTEDSLEVQEPMRTNKRSSAHLIQ